jgi:putative tributyrin esterase
MRLRSAAAVLVLGVPACAPSGHSPLYAATPVATGTMHTFTIAAPSVRDAHRTVRVYLPAGYDRPAADARRYPVVYLLHGWPGSDGNWVTRGKAAETADRLIAAGRMPATILVFPDGRGRGLLGRSLYVDAYDGTSNVETFIARDLVAWVDSTFRTRADARDRAVIGLSDGGTGAVNLALRHPDVFGACGSHSADFVLHKGFGTGGVLGPEPGASRLMADHSPLLYVDTMTDVARRLVIYFDCGTGDESIADNRAFDAKLTALGIPHVFHEYPGSHTWGYWRDHLVESLVAVTSRM